MVTPQCSALRERRPAFPGAAPAERSAGAALPQQLFSPCRGASANLSCRKTTAAVLLGGIPMGAAEERFVLLAGANGLAGGCALDALLEAPEVQRVTAVSRRPLARQHRRLANRIVQFERLEAQLKGASCDVALCCLGTTIRQAGSEQAFRAVDVDCVLAFARAAKAAGARRFVVISSVGADTNARNFYLRTKGEMEEQLIAV